MPNDTVRVKFEIDPGGAGTAALREKDRLIQEVVQHFKDLGQKLPLAQIREFSTYSADAMRQIRDQVIGVDRAVQQLQQTLAATRGQSVLAGQFDVRSRTGLTGGDPNLAANEAIAASVSSAARRQQDLSIATESLRGRFETAARAGKEGFDSVGKATDKAAASGRVFSGTTYVGTQLLRTLGVDGSRAIEVVGRQFLDLGLTFKQLLDSRLIGFTFLAASVIGVAEVVKSLSSNIRDMAEGLRDLESHGAKFTLAGLVGSPDQIDSAVKALEKAKQASEFFLQQGNVGGLQQELGRALGGRASEEEISRAQTRLEGLRRESTTFFGILSGHGGQSIFATNSKEIREARSELEKLQGGIVTFEQLTTRLGQTDSLFGKFQSFLKSRGEKNVFDDAFESLRSLAKETGNLGRLEDNITRLAERGQSGKLTPEQFAEEIRNLTKGLKDVKDIQDQLHKSNEIILKDLENQAKFEKELSGARKSIADLTIQAEDDPLVKLIQQADERTREFFERIKTFPRELQGELRKAFLASNAKLELRDLFNLEFGLGASDRGFAGDITRLQAGLSPNAFGLQEEDRRRLAQGQLQDARRAGNINSVRDAQAALISREAQLQEEIRQATIARNFTRAAELENLLGSTARETLSRNIENQIRETNLEDLKQRLSRETRQPQQVFLLDKILEATSKVGDLTADQRDFRLKVLQQRLNIGEAERHKVLIEIKNATDATTSVDGELGPNNKSGSQPFIPVSGGATSPFSGEGGASDQLGSDFL